MSADDAVTRGCVLGHASVDLVQGRAERLQLRRFRPPAFAQLLGAGPQAVQLVHERGDVPLRRV